MMGQSVDEDYIVFADPNVEAICAANWGKKGKLTYKQAAKVTSLADVFKKNTTITSFDELQYFTSLTALGTSATITQNTHSQFYGCTALTSITLPPSLTMIGSYSFYGCTSLSNISGLENVTVLGREAFVNCTSLSIEVNLPNLTAIYNGAFKSSAITKVLSLGSITALTCASDYGVFQACTALTSVVLPNTLTNIQQYSFYGCTHLANINFPASITTIGAYAFYNCTALGIEFSCPNLTSIGASALRKSGITKILDLGSITTTNTYLCSNCQNITEIHIPATCTTVGQCAFEVYNSTATPTAVVYSYSTTPPSYGNSCFRAGKVSAVYVPSESVSSYQTTWSALSAKIQAI